MSASKSTIPTTSTRTRGRIMMFKCVHGMAPDYLCDSITLHKDIANNIITRSYDDVNKVHVPRAPIQLFKNAFAYSGICYPKL